MFFGGELRRTKTWKAGPLKNVNFNLLSFKRCPYDSNFWTISLRDLNIILGAWNGFSGKLRSAFFLKLRFLKIGILVTWLKCLANYGYIEVGFPRASWQSWLEISSLQSFHQLVSRSQLFCLDFENYLGVWRLQALRQLGLWWPCGRLHFLSII